MNTKHDRMQLVPDRTGNTPTTTKTDLSQMPRHCKTSRRPQKTRDQPN